MGKDSKKQTPALTISNNFLLVVAFVEGAAVMGAELIGAKMIGPFYGNSLYVWASVLAVTMAGLATGYFLGGVLSKKYKSPNVLFIILAIASLLIFVMPGWGNITMKITANLSVQTASLMSCILFLFPPLVCFGMVSPLIIQHVNLDQGHAGKSAGTVYAISTVGGIVMTILAGFYLIPLMGLRVSAYSIAFMLAIFPIIYFIGRKNFVYPAAILFLGMAFSYAGVSKPRIPEEGGEFLEVHHLSDGLLGQMMVAEINNPKAQVHYRSLFVNNISQTKTHVSMNANDNGRSEWRYVHRLALYSSYKPAGSNVLVCGLGGGNLINELLSRSFNVDVVEIDPRMEQLAKDYFFMREGANVFVDDARHYINTCTKKYDIVILDMSAGENQPVNVYTKEGFTKIQDMLAPDGIMFLHYNNKLEGPDAIAAKSIMKTIDAAGFNVELLNTVPADKWNKVNEIQFMASMSPLVLHEQSFQTRDPWADPFAFPTGENVYSKNYDFSDGYLLTDDLPIMELLHLNTLDVLRGADFEQQLKFMLDEKVDFI